ncbi:hypothetical protein GOP47_0028492 [Adiantum capillus-veneris]|nr:hypothetical protein GOP47_0028492 [Adiantum capillus-veneris]
MVLWEITLATAYWLGIRKTYKLALKLERRLISPKHPRLRDFMQRRTRNVFDIALRVHREIQSRDLSAGKSLGNFILRFLDRARPSAKIRGPPCLPENAGQKKLSAGSGDKGPTSKSMKSNTGPDKVLFSQYVNKAPFVQTISNRLSVGIGRRCPGLQDTKSVSGLRPCTTTAGLVWEKSGSSIPIAWRGSSFEKGIFRSDIAQWMGRKQ